MTEEPDGRFQHLRALGERLDLGVALGQLALHLATRGEHQAVRHVDAAGGGADQQDQPERRANEEQEADRGPDLDALVARRVRAACSRVSGVSGLIEQSGPSSSPRPSIARTAAPACWATTSGVSVAITGLAGSPPITARPLRRRPSASEGLPSASAHEMACAG